MFMVYYVVRSDKQGIVDDLVCREVWLDAG